MSSSLVYTLNNNTAVTLYVMDSSRYAEMPSLSQVKLVGNNLKVSPSLTDLSNAYSLTEDNAGDPFCLIESSGAYDCISDQLYYRDTDSDSVGDIVSAVGCNATRYHSFSIDSSLTTPSSCSLVTAGSYYFDPSDSYKGFTLATPLPSNSDNSNILLIAVLAVVLIVIVVIGIAGIAYLVRNRS